MGRSKARSKRTGKIEYADAAAAPSASSKRGLSTDALLVKAASFMPTFDYDKAQEWAQKAVKAAVTETEKRDSLETLGTIELEMGEPELARQHLQASIEIASKLPDPSPAPHLYLAQMSETPQESLQHFQNALQLLKAKLEAIQQARATSAAQVSEEEAEEELDTRRSASKALVGMTELYLTDLCFEPEAESNCESYLAQAFELDPEDPEVYQTMASVRISQQRTDDAKEVLAKGWAIWRDLEPDDPKYPLAPIRANYARTWLELGEYRNSIDILQRLEREDDEDAETWYLMGWAWWLLGEQKPEANGSMTNGHAAEDEDTRQECWSEAKLCLENYLTYDSVDPEDSIPEQKAHVEEMLSKLNALGVEASQRNVEGEDEWEDDDSDGDVMQE